MVSPLPISCIAAALCTVGCAASWPCVSCVGFVFLVLIYSTYTTEQLNSVFYLLRVRLLSRLTLGPI
jgi:hypothetical protein